jgi:hypothetical protein
MRLAELQRRKALGIGAGIDEPLHPSHYLNNPWVFERKRTANKLAIIVRPRLPEKRLKQKQAARERPVADTLRDRSNAGCDAFFDEIGETSLGELKIRRNFGANLFDEILIVIEFDRIGLDRDTVDFAFRSPGWPRPLTGSRPCERSTACSICCSAGSKTLGGSRFTRSSARQYLPDPF